MIVSCHFSVNTVIIMGFAIKDNVKYIGIDIIANLMINSLNV